VHVLFDLDGTLTDPGPGITGCIQHALASLGLRPPAASDLRHCIGPPLRESLAALLGPDGGTRVEEALRLYRARYAAEGLFENQVYPGIEAALAALSRQGHRLWVATSKPQVYALQIVEHFGLAPYFAGVHGSELGGAHADKGDLIAHILRTEGIAPEGAWMVGDRRHDVAGARRNRVSAVGVLWGYGSEEELRAAGAARIVTRPAELCALLGATAGARTAASRSTP
jgi:phosphoglycolate phosphatase